MDVGVRKAAPCDRLAIETLCRKARYALPRLWWWEEHLADDLFVVVERGGVVVGALLAWPDESPVAWVRLAAVDDSLGVGEWLSLTLADVIDGLRRRMTRRLAWLDYGGWAGPYLKASNFNPRTDVVTLTKFDRVLPRLSTGDVCLRCASGMDVSAVVAVDRAAFTPHWWRSESTIRRRITELSHLVVAEVAGKVIGYAEGTLRLPVAHLNRLAVRPAYQGHGVGALLLRDALRTFWQRGAGRVTLNTQTDNRSSLRLYRRFGFEPIGDRVTAWELQL
jgi:ribosomal-protein-alanine N-acetyltransferase